jgi:hypothetical protein
MSKELTYLLSISGTNTFCEDWAKSMQEIDEDNPVYLKQIIENQKLKVISSCEPFHLY